MSIKQIEAAIRFTDAYRKYAGCHPAIREVMCIAELYPCLLPPMSREDTFAGALGEHVQSSLLPLNFSPQFGAQIGYTMNPPLLRRLADEHPAYREKIEELIAFWKTESTFVKIRNEAPKDVRDYLFPYGVGLDSDGYHRKSDRKRPLGSGFISGSFDTRAAGLMPDFDKLMRLGLPGLYAEIGDAEKRNPDGKDFYTAAKKAVDIVRDCCLAYREQALALGLSESADILENITKRAPVTLREGIQLLLIFTTILHTENYGRLDITFGRLLRDDFESHRLDEEGAVLLLCEFWKVFEKWGSNYDSRVIVGGVGRPDEEAADRFSLLAMEATRRRHAVVPVLTLRWSKTQAPALLDRALELIGEGCIYPTLYNDDAYIPGVMRGMHVPKEHAVRYVPLGCGELTLDHTSVGSPNSTFRFVKALEATLHNGCDGVTGNRIGVDTGSLSDFDTYEKLEQAFFRQIRAAMEQEARVHAWNRKITARETAYVHASLLTDGCIERGRGLHDGGARYFGANSEGFGQTNAVNSLAVIKRLVYEKKRFTLREIVDILDKNYEGHEKERRLFLQVPKYGNNDPLPDEIKRRFDEFVNRTADEIGRKNGFDYYTVASVNPGGITIGPRVAASADGRHCGEPMTLGNSPHPGTDKSGLTAMLISAACVDAANGGVVTNMNLSRDTLIRHREKVKAAFLAYFGMGGLQLNVNCFSKGDLEKALLHPENYSGLIVRVSGYSARFIDLDPVTQRHLLERTLY